MGDNKKVDLDVLEQRYRLAPRKEEMSYYYKNYDDSDPSCVVVETFIDGDGKELTDLSDCKKAETATVNVRAADESTRKAIADAKSYPVQMIELFPTKDGAKKAKLETPEKQHPAHVRAEKAKKQLAA